MNLLSKLKRWNWLAVVVSASTGLALWSVLMQPEEAAPPAAEAEIVQVLGRTQATARLRTNAEEFHAAQKEKRIQRMIAEVQQAGQRRDALSASALYGRRLEELAAEDVPLLFERLDAATRQSEFGVLLYRRWLEVDPAAATSWLDRLAEGEERVAWGEQAASVWGSHDLAAARAWVQTLPLGAGREAAVFALAGEAVREDPFAALELGQSLPAGADRDRLLLRAIGEWAAREPVAALRWTSGIPEAAWQQQVRRQLVPVIASIDARAAAQLAGAWLQAGPEAERTVMLVIQHLAQQSPETAAAWVRQFPAGGLRQSATEYLARMDRLRAQDAVVP